MKTAMKTAIWFSRHQPSPSQLEEISLGYQLADLEEGMALGGRSLDSHADVARVLRDLQTLIERHEASAVFGVFPTPLLGEFVDCQEGTPFFASWNVNRAPEGQKPQFTHKKWVLIGWYE
jgi:hypothetical protein